MSIQPVANQIAPLNSYLTTNSEQLAVTQRRKAIMYDVAQKVCIIAAFAIVGVLFAASLQLVAGTLPQLLALLFAYICCHKGASVCGERQRNLYQLAASEKQIAEQLKEISHWTHEDVRNFFRANDLPIHRIPLERLSTLNPAQPLLALLPVIARFQCLEKIAKTKYAEAQDQLNCKSAIPEIRFEAHRIGWENLESEAVPAALKAAVMLQIIADPTRELNIQSLGRFTAKSLLSRWYNRSPLVDNDDYFILNPSNPEHAPKVLTLGEITATAVSREPKALRFKLFPEEVRA